MEAMRSYSGRREVVLAKALLGLHRRSPDAGLCIESIEKWGVSPSFWHLVRQDAVLSNKLEAEIEKSLKAGQPVRTQAKLLRVLASVTSDTAGVAQRLMDIARLHDNTPDGRLIGGFAYDGLAQLAARDHAVAEKAAPYFFAEYDKADKA